jgi:MFS family permease
MRENDVTPADGAAARRALPRTSVLLALIIGQICLHGTMAGVRMARPLWVLRRSHGAWTIGVLMGLFAAAPIALALHAGRLADRHGYHRPLYVAVGLTAAGGACALLATGVPAPVDFVLLCMSAILTGAGANFGLITIRRSAGRSAVGATELKRVFSWLGLAPALANVAGPVLAGVLIDHGGFRVAFGALMLLPLQGLWWARCVPREPVQPPDSRPPGRPPAAHGTCCARRAYDACSR